MVVSVLFPLLFGRTFFVVMVLLVTVVEYLMIH